MRKIRKVIGALLLITAILVTQIPGVETSAAPSSNFQIDQGKLVKYTGTAATVSIPDSVEVIGAEAFAGNTSLTALNVGKNVTTIEYGAFKDCTYLSKVTLSDKVVEIRNAVFSGNTSLKSITLPKKLKELGSGVFAGCSNLYTIKVPKENKNFIFAKNGLYNKDKTLLYCFAEGAKIEKFKLPSTVTDIDEYAFWGNDSLKQISLSSNLREIPSYAFSNCRRLTEISIPYSVKSIDSKAFENCISLQKTEIPASVSYIHATAFDGCPKLEIKADSGTTAHTFYENWKVVNQTNVDTETGNDNTVVDSEGNVYIVGSDGKLVKVEKDKESSNTYTDAMHDPSNVDYIPENDPLADAEDGVLGKTMIVGQNAVVIMDSQMPVVSGIENREVSPEEEKEAENENDFVDNTKGDALPKYAIVNKNITDYAYYGDTALTSYTVPANITKIGNFSFARSGLESIHIPKGVTQIGYAAFYHCDNLKEISIPNTVTWIEPSAFAYTGWLNSWAGNADANDFLIVGDGVLLSYKGNSRYVEIPSGVETIAPACFMGHEEIEGVKIPDSVTVIGEEAFMNCSSLQNVHGAENVKKIQDRAFKNTDIREITIGEYVEKIGIGAFQCSDNNNRKVIFEGEDLPQISHTDSTSRLSANLTEPVFEGNWTAIVESKNIKLDNTIMDHSEFGFSGDIATQDSNGNISVFDSLTTKNTVGKKVSVISEVAEWSSDKITVGVPYDGEYLLTISEKNTENVEDAFRRVYGNKVPPMKVINITLEDSEGVVEYTNFGTNPLSVMVPLPTEIKGNTVHVAALDQDGQLELVASSIQSQNGKDYIQFKTSHLSTFVIYALGEDGTVQIENGEVTLTAVSGKKDYSPNTGDYSVHPKWFVALGLTAVAIACIAYKPKKRKQK